MIPKFRYFNKLTKEMYTSDFCVTSDGRVIDTYDLNNPVDMGDTAILMQSTGLKDKNGVEIFEGDVVKCYIVTEKGEYEYVGVVCLKDFAFVIVDEKDTYDPLWNYKSGFVDIETEIEIIGNIYENPELLEVSNV